MKTNNQKKPKNKIFIIWGLFITGVILVFLIFLLLAMNKPQPNIDTQNKQTLQPNVNDKQEQEKTYNAIMDKLNKEIDALTTSKKVIFQPDSKIIKIIEIYNSDNKKIKLINYRDDGKTVSFINEYNPDIGSLIKITNYNLDGSIKSIIEDDK